MKGRTISAAPKAQAAMSTHQPSPEISKQVLGTESHLATSTTTPAHITTHLCCRGGAQQKIVQETTRQESQPISRPTT